MCYMEVKKHLYDHIVRNCKYEEFGAFIKMPTYIEMPSSKSNCYVIHGGAKYICKTVL